MIVSYEHEWSYTYGFGDEDCAELVRCLLYFGCLPGLYHTHRTSYIALHTLFLHPVYPYLRRPLY
jgi:hypothetical protein